jgi:preprotein translocase subunit SecA
VVEEQRPKLAPQSFTYTAPAGPSGSAPAGPAASLTAPAGDAPGSTGAPNAEEPAPQQPVVKSEWEKTPRNAPCPCGSGKKYKVCHGA